jgi:branched-chain amino acid transport system permease protein
VFELTAVTPTDLIQYSIGGLTNGSIYALVALGYHIIFRGTRVINFAQGELVVVGGLLALVLIAEARVPLALAFVVAIVLCGAIGFAIEKVAVRPVYRSGQLAAIIVTVGLLIMLRNTHQAVWGSQSRAFPAFGNEPPFSLLTPTFVAASDAFFIATGAGFSPTYAWVVLLSLAALLVTWAFFQRTRFGKAMRATADNPLAAESVGINTRTVTAASFAISLALAGAAGILAAPLLYAGGSFGIEVGLKGFAAALVGGLSSPLGVVVGGYLIGLIEALSGGILSPQYKEAIAFSLMFVMLLLRPTGLFGERLAARA